MLRMNRSIFEKLCCLVNSIGGLQRRTLELVAIFFVTVGHNIKNRTAQVLFHRSAETISRTIREVLCSILKLHHILLAEPIPVPDNCTDARWKYFKGKATERARDYKVWTKEEDKVFIYNLQKLAREKYIENGSFHPGGYKELERLMNIDVPGCNIKVDPHIKSRFHWWKYKFVAQNYLRNSSGSGWDDARGCVSMEELKFAEWLTVTYSTFELILADC
ncbi:hypothetical protein LINPERPRIM_LOCUS6517 [Linum perenne]